MNNLKPLMSSERQDWATPQPLFDYLHANFHLELDVCALPENAKCKRFLTPDQDGLKEHWVNWRFFMNPPYGRDISHWVKKAAEDGTAGTDSLGVCLLPARTDTAWWHDHVMAKASRIIFCRGRIWFVGAPGPAPFPSALVVFSPFWAGPASFEVLDVRKFNK